MLGMAQQGKAFFRSLGMDALYSALDPKRRERRCLRAKQAAKAWGKKVYVVVRLGEWRCCLRPVETDKIVWEAKP